MAGRVMRHDAGVCTNAICPDLALPAFRRAKHHFSNVLLLVFDVDDFVLQLIPFVLPSFISSLREITRLVESKEREFCGFELRESSRTKGYVPSDPPAYKMERVSSVERRARSLFRLNFLLVSS